MPQLATIVQAINAIVDLDGGRAGALKSVAEATANETAIRTQLDTHQALLGNISFQTGADHRGDETVVTDAHAVEIRRLAAKRLIELSIASKRDLTHRAELLAVANAPNVQEVRTQLNGQANLANINFQVGGGDQRANEAILSDDDAGLMREQAIVKLVQLTIAAKNNLDHANQLRALANAANGNAIRTAIHSVVELGAVDLGAHINDENVLSDDQATILRQVATEQLLRLSIAAVADLDAGREAALLAVASGVDDDGVRQALHDQRAYFGNVDLTGHINGDGTQVSNEVARELRNLAAYRLVELSIQATTLNNQVELQHLANANGSQVIRTVLDNNEELGHINFNGNLNNSVVLRDNQANHLRRLAAQKLLELNIKDTHTVRESNYLRDVANTTDETAVRTQANAHKALLGDVDFKIGGDHRNDEVVLTNGANGQAVQVRQVAANQLIHLVIREKEGLTHAIQLRAVSTAATRVAIRTALDTHKEFLGGVNFQLGGDHRTDQLVLNDVQAIAIRQEVVVKLLELSIKAKNNLGHDQALLNAIATANDPSAVRVVLNTNRAFLGDLDDHVADDNSIITDNFAHCLKKVAETQLKKLQYEAKQPTIYQERLRKSLAKLNGTGASIQSFEEGNISLPEFQIIACALHPNFNRDTLKEAANPSQPALKTHTVVLPDNSRFKREQLTATTAQFDWSNIQEKISPYQIFKKMAEGIKAEWNTKRKSLTNDDLVLQEIDINTESDKDLVRRECLLAFKNAGFKHVSINAVAHLVAAY